MISKAHETGENPKKLWQTLQAKSYHLNNLMQFLARLPCPVY